MICWSLVDFVSFELRRVFGLDVVDARVFG